MTDLIGNKKTERIRSAEELIAQGEKVLAEAGLRAEDFLIKPGKAKKEPPKAEPETQEHTPIFPGSVSDSFILSYNPFGIALISKSNEYFQGTKAEIPLMQADNQTPLKGEVQNMYLLKRLALVTALYKNPGLNPDNFWPISPEQSERLLHDGKMPNASTSWEDLALLLYGHSSKGQNPVEAKALYESMKRYQRELGLSKSDLEKKLVVVNAGLEKNDKAPHGVVPVVLPGLTEAYHLDVLEKVGPNQEFKFEYGLDRGLPKIDDLGKGTRTLYMPSETANIGLRVLVRGRNLDVVAGDGGLVSSDAGGRVRFAPQGAKKS